MNSEYPVVSILWTGGWDSSYRVIELSRMRVSIQPVYILDERRASNQRELNSIQTITDMLKARQETVADFLPLQIENVNKLAKNEHIDEVTQKLREQYDWGIQHNWTAKVALKYPMIEMCIEKVVKGYMPTREIIRDHGKLVETEMGLVVDQENSDDILITALGNIRLPVFEITEQQMRDNIQAWGYEDVMKNIWFCHNPIDGKPCGLCSPCHTKFDSKMEFLLPDTAIERCKKAVVVDQKFGKLSGKIYRKVIRAMIKANLHK